MLQEIYNYLDGKIMNVTNAGVRTYNWTTGGTKADLADHLLTGSVILYASGLFLVNPLSVPLMTPLLLFSAYKAQNFNREFERKEISALESGRLDPLVESAKENYFKPGSALFFAVGFFGNSLYALPGPESNGLSVTFSGFFFTSAENYVMRTDYLPPRKNCFRRGLEKLEEIAKSYKAGAQAEPVPA